MFREKSQKIRYAGVIFRKLVVTSWAAGLALGTLLRPTCVQAKESESGRWLAVERGPSAAGCPSEEALERQVESLLEEIPEGASVDVRFRYQRGTFVAEIRREGRRAVRVLSDTHMDCGPLGSATATSIALALEMDPPVVHVEPEVPPVLASTVQEPTLPRPTTSSDLSLGVLARGGGAHGAVSGTGAFLGGEALLGWRRLRARLGVLRVLPREFPLGPGVVRQDLWAATTTLCARAYQSEVLSLDGCSGIYLGLLLAEARGLTENRIETRPWTAVPIEAVGNVSLASTDRARLSLLLSASAWVARSRETFVATGVSGELQTQRVAVSGWAGLSVEWKIPKN